MTKRVEDEIVPWDEAQRARLMSFVATLPDPRRVAESLRECSLMALINAERDRVGGYRLRRSDWHSPAFKQLVAAGIVESGWGGIGSFGMKVRRVALKMKQDGELG